MTSALTRRDFIVVTSAAGAGLVLGVYASRSGAGEAAAPATGPQADFAPNAWVRIAVDGTVTVTVAKSEMGQGIRTALPMIVAEELDADWAMVRIEQALADDKYGSMVTGGSMSVRTSWETLRKAGAAARMMLLGAAAQRWNVAVTECRTERGTVVHEPTGRALRYGELAQDAARLPVPGDPPLKQPSEFRIIGQRIPRLDTPGKVDGSAVFGLDVRVPGMLFAAIARCPVFGGKMASFDGARARAMPGVRHVLPMFRGVAVAADTTWQALRARDALEVEWNEGASASVSSADISRTLAALAGGQGAVAESAGDADGTLAGAVKTLTATYEVPFLAHATMEPMNCTAHVREDRCEVWAPTQHAQAARQAAVAVSGLPAEQVIVHTTLIGGGFGRRLSVDYVAEAVAVSRAVGEPVQVVWSREDDMRHDFYRPVSLHVLAGGLDAGGRLVALKHRVVAPSIGAQSEPDEYKDGLDRGAVEGTTRMAYAVPNLLIDYVMAQVPVPLGYWRSVYPSQNVFALESFIDELAHAAGADPVEFRLSMMGASPKMKRVLELAAARAGWGESPPPGRYRGVAFSPPAFFHTPVAQVAEVSVADDGTIRVHRVVGAIDCGIVVNPTGVEAQMEGGTAFAITAALKSRITIGRGRVVQRNFHDYPLLRIDEMPVVETHVVPSAEPPTGTGEPVLPAVAPAIANAVFAATGKRLRNLPLAL